MIERPILFSGEMVKAILDGRKTMTRRVVKPQPKFDPPKVQEIWRCHYGQVGDRLWVREKFLLETRNDIDNHTSVIYRATGNSDYHGVHPKNNCFYRTKWKPAITLEIINIRIERLQEITEDDCIKEGLRPLYCWAAGSDKISRNAEIMKNEFKSLWDSINGKKHPWESNPWCWVIEFKKEAACKS